MAEVSEIEAGGEVRTIKDTTARSGVAANTLAITAIQNVIPSDTTADNKLVNASQLSNTRKADKIIWSKKEILLENIPPNDYRATTIQPSSNKKIVAIGCICIHPVSTWGNVLLVGSADLDGYAASITTYCQTITGGGYTQNYLLKAWVGEQDL